MLVTATYRDVDPPPGPDLVDALGAVARAEEALASLGGPPTLV